MKKIALSFVISTLNLICFAQNVRIGGTVTDEQGKPVPFAFIKDSSNNATFSGPEGNYSLYTSSSSLVASAKGYKEAKVVVGGMTNIKILLASDPQAVNAPIDKSKSEKLFDSYLNVNADRSTRPIAFFAKGHEDLHGSRYFSNGWVHGYAKSAEDSIFENNSYLFNYDKIDGVLLYTNNGATMNATAQAIVKKFVLFDDDGIQSAFEMVPEIDSKHYLEVISSGSKYKIYKQLNTIYHPADFQTNGVTSSGQNYDSYDDNIVYYVVKFPGGKPQKISLKRKAIKTAFAAEADKINKYLSDHDSDEVDDNFLKAVGEYMNN